MPFDQPGGAAARSAKILSVAVAAPPHVLMQSQVTQAARMLFADRVDDFDRIAQVFASTGILKRHSVVPLDWFLGRIGWPERTRRISKAPMRCSSRLRPRRSTGRD